MKNKAEIKTIVLKNLRLDLISKFTDLIEKSIANEKYESEELTKEYFQGKAYTEINTELLKVIQSNNEKLMFLIK